jgi:hypothetical protein
MGIRCRAPISAPCEAAFRAVMCYNVRVWMMI